MSAQTSNIVRLVPKSRYVKVPETVHVKSLRDFWFSNAVEVDWLAQVMDGLIASSRLTVGRFKTIAWYATFVSDVDRPEEWPNAVSGWGDTPLKAIYELAFRWHVGMRGKWDPAYWNLQMVPRWETQDGKPAETVG